MVYRFLTLFSVINIFFPLVSMDCTTSCSKQTHLSETAVNLLRICGYEVIPRLADLACQVAYEYSKETKTGWEKLPADIREKFVVMLRQEYMVDSIKKKLYKPRIEKLTEKKLFKPRIEKLESARFWRNTHNNWKFGDVSISNWRVSPNGRYLFTFDPRYAPCTYVSDLTVLDNGKPRQLFQSSYISIMQKPGPLLVKPFALKGVLAAITQDSRYALLVSMINGFRNSIIDLVSETIIPIDELFQLDTDIIEFKQNRSYKIYRNLKVFPEDWDQYTDVQKQEYKERLADFEKQSEAESYFFCARGFGIFKNNDVLPLALCKLRGTEEDLSKLLNGIRAANVPLRELLQPFLFDQNLTFSLICSLLIKYVRLNKEMERSTAVVTASTPDGKYVIFGHDKFITFFDFSKQLSTNPCTFICPVGGSIQYMALSSDGKYALITVNACTEKRDFEGIGSTWSSSRSLWFWHDRRCNHNRCNSERGLTWSLHNFKDRWPEANIPGLQWGDPLERRDGANYQSFDEIHDYSPHQKIILFTIDKGDFHVLYEDKMVGYMGFAPGGRSFFIMCMDHIENPNHSVLGINTYRYDNNDIHIYDTQETENGDRRKQLIIALWLIYAVVMYCNTMVLCQ